MEFSQVFRGTTSVGCVPSPEGHLVASVVGSRLTLRSAMTQELKRSIQLKDDIGSKVQFIRWSPRATNKEVTGLNGLSAKRRSGIDKTEEEGGATARILIATADAAWIYDVEDEKWHATISQGIKGIKNVEFGRNADEVLIFSEFQLKMTVWSLRTAKQIDIPHPKFTSKGFGYRPCTSHFALLTRPATHDVVSVHCHTTYRTVAKFTLPTMDAQGLKWSPCGRWLAVWDSAAAGYKVLIYTADGHLFRTREKPCEGLGIKTVEWSPASEFLVVGSYDGKISFLSTYTFSPVIEMNHTMTVNIQAIPVWSETVLANKERHYLPLQQPVVLPTLSSTPADAYSRLGVSVVAFNVDSTLVATRSDNMPTAIWIWSLKLLRPFAILVHLAPVKSIAWHPTIPDLLMLTCAPDPNSKDQQPAVYIWCASWKQPRAILLPIEKAGQNSWCKWINNPHVSTSHSSNGSISGDLVRGNSPDKHVEIQQPALVFGSKDGFVVGYVDEEEFNPEDMKKDTNEDDSFLYSADKHNWSPREWQYYSPSRASLQANAMNHPSSPSPTRRNVVSQKKEGDEAAVDYRANRRITMKS